jgi:hypothetical protein
MKIVIGKADLQELSLWIRGRYYIALVLIRQLIDGRAGTRRREWAMALEDYYTALGTRIWRDYERRA